MFTRTTISSATLLCCLALTACGGGDSAPEVIGSPPVDPAAAASATASNHPSCTEVRPFYWEIGDADGVLASGSVGTKDDGNPWSRTDVMNIASASKWLYSAYAVERKNGALDEQDDVPLLNFTSGYSNFSNLLCRSSDTIAQCLNGDRNQGEADAAVFHYNAGHFQTHAAANGLGSLDAAALGPEISRVLGSGVDVAYTEPQLAGGARMSTASYANFLRKMLGSTPTLKIGSLLGSSAVCTREGSNCQASDPAVVPEDWHYSLGHWVEDDPQTLPSSNFAYSSGGAFGFYPWVDTARTLYGIVAREDLDSGGEGYDSGLCGRQIRQAWKTGVEQ
jgi:hypothetical protein